MNPGTPRCIVLALAASLALSCQSAPEAAPEPATQPPAAPQPTDGGGFTMCQVPRPQACTKEYEPVCAHLADGSLVTRPNGCTACSDVSIFGHRPGTCR